LTLMERVQVETAHVAEFENIRTFSVFNTNSVWIRLSALEELINDDLIDFPLIVNPKKVGGMNAIQLETAMGAALSIFKKSRCTLVTRSRFLPVKSLSDLLLVQSDIFTLKSDGRLVLSEDFQGALPAIGLGAFYNSVASFQERFEQIPSLIDAKTLLIEGDIVFGPGIVIRGDVELRGPNNAQVKLENRVFESGVYIL